MFWNVLECASGLIRRYLEVFKNLLKALGGFLRVLGLLQVLEGSRKFLNRKFEELVKNSGSFSGFWNSSKL